MPANSSSTDDSVLDLPSGPTATYRLLPNRILAEAIDAGILEPRTVLELAFIPTAGLDAALDEGTIEVLAEMDGDQLVLTLVAS